jgi:bacterioferritin-associated ferredoxin
MPLLSINAYLDRVYYPTLAYVQGFYMYVCLCHAITDTQIKQAVGQGDSSLADVRKRLGVADQCGKCAKMATKIIQNQLEIEPNFYEVA